MADLVWGTITTRTKQYLEKYMSAKADTEEEVEAYESILEWCEQNCSMMESGEILYAFNVPSDGATIEDHYGNDVPDLIRESLVEAMQSRIVYNMVVFILG